MATAYIETTIPSLYTGRPAERLVEAARQNLTKVWWDNHRHEFDLVCSQTVLDECSEGDSEMAEKRIKLLADIPLLELTDDVRSIAELLLSKQIIPEKAADDAVHIAVASVHRIDYLVTWNCKHLANPRNWRRISDCVASFGFRATVICTPEDLIGDDS
jgi:predicted nucleic acid-binding protein